MTACPGTRRRRPRRCPGSATRRPRPPARSVSTRLGPSRNFAAPTRQAAHLRLPGGLDEVGQRPARQPSGRLPARPVRRARGLHRRRPDTAGVYDTVYVDLDNDHYFVDEKPVTKASPASYRDMNGDGYTDLSGGLALLHLGRHRPSGAACRAARPCSALDVKARARASSSRGRGDFDPAIGGHGTLTASNVVGQGVINGHAPTFADVPGGNVPGRGHRRRAARQARPVRRHLLLVRLLDPVRLLPRGRATASTSRRTRTAPRTRQ